MKCSQCERPAIGQYGNMPLCVEHFAIFQRTLSERQADAERMINYLSDQMDETIGIPSYTRFRTPTPVIHKGNTIVNQLNIDRSTIGLLNTGIVENINSTITMVEGAGHKELADTIKDFTEAVAQNTEITNEAKKEIIEQLSFLGSQIRTPQEKRNPSVIKTVFGAIGSAVSTANNLLTLWQKLELMIKNFLT